MVGSALTLALVGLGAVSNAMPAPTRTLKDRQTWVIGGGDGSFNFGSDVPTTACLEGIPVNEQPPCIPVIISGGINAGKREVKERQTWIIGGGDGSFNWGGNVPSTRCIDGIPLNEQPPCIPAIIGGGLKPPKDKRFTLPAGWNTDINKAIDSLEIRLEKLQNKSHKSRQDRDEIDNIYAALNYLVGITDIHAPPGTTTTLHPGKREILGTLGGYSDSCPDLDGAERALEHLMHKDHPSVHEYIIMHKLKSFLYGCGITIVKSPDGTSTTIKPSDKRDTSALILPTDAHANFDLAGLQIAYEKLAQSIGHSRPSFSTWLAMQQIAATLELYGIKIEKTPSGTTTIIVPSTKTKRQTFTIGNQTCQLADMIGLKAALAALYAAYGPPEQAPDNIFLIEQVIVSTLQLCGQTVNGWTSITPGNPLPGGAIIPDPTQTGAPIIPDQSGSGSSMVPDPVQSGSSMVPDPVQSGSALIPEPTETGSPLIPSDKRQAPIADPAALLAALQLLEEQYGAYGSGTIPVPVFLIMANIVTILQDIPGVVVTGWPLLGAGSIRPSP